MTRNYYEYIFNIDSQTKVEPCGDGIRRGWGCWGGYGYGFRRFISPKNELAALEDEEKMLEEELAAIREEKAALKDQQK